MTDELVAPTPSPAIRSGRRFYLLATAAILTAYIVIGISFWILATVRWSSALRLTERPRIVDAPHVTRGAALQYEFSYCRSEEGSLQIARAFVQASDADGSFNYTPLAQMIVSLTKGCHTARLPLMVPLALTPGSYTLRLTFLDAASRRREVITETEAFRVE